MNRLVLKCKSDCSSGYMEYDLAYIKASGEICIEELKLKYAGYYVTNIDFRKGQSWFIPKSRIDEIVKHISEHKWYTMDPEIWITEKKKDGKWVKIPEIQLL